MVNKKLKFVSRLVMCGMIMIMAAGVGERVMASDNNNVLLLASDTTAASDLESASAEESESALTAGTGTGSVAQPLTTLAYFFSLRTFGKEGEDKDVTVMRRKDTDFFSFVEGAGGYDGGIIIWAVGSNQEGLVNLLNCADCSNNNKYVLEKDNKIYMYNAAHAAGYQYTAIAGGFLEEEEVVLYGRFIPDYDSREVE